MSIFRGSAVGLLIALVPFGRVEAQVREAVDPGRHATCQAVASGIDDQISPDSAKSSLWLLRGCGISGPPAIISIWDTVSTVSLLVPLVEASRTLRDVRILDAVANVAGDQSRDQKVRVAGVKVLISYFAEGYVEGPNLFSTPDSAGSLWTLSHVYSEPTDHPLTSAASGKIASALRDISQSDPDPILQSAARVIRQDFAFMKGREVSLIPGALKLHYLCGNRFRIRNKDNIAIQVGYEVQETGEERTVNLEARPEHGPPSETTFTTRTTGTVDIIYNGEVLASERNKGKECK